LHTTDAGEGRAKCTQKKFLDIQINFSTRRNGESGERVARKNFCPAEAEDGLEPSPDQVACSYTRTEYDTQPFLVIAAVLVSGRMRWRAGLHLAWARL
jgi:hypothetical protein